MKLKMNKEFKGVYNANKPIVSVVMANYNYARFINDAISSVISQSFENFELIVVDDCSKDSSVGIIKDWMKKDIRIKAIFHKKNKGIAKTFNDGIMYANGKYIFLMASDDMLKKNTLERCLNVFNKLNSEKYGAILFDAEVIDAENKKTGLLFSDIHRKPSKIKGNFFKDLLKGNFIMTGMLKRNLITKFRIYFNENLKHLNDWLFWLDLSYVSDFYYIEEPLYYYRVHDSNSSLDKDGYCEDIAKIYNIIEQRYKLDKYSKNIVFRKKAIEYYMEILNDIKNAKTYLLKAFKNYPFDIKTFILLIFIYSPYFLKKLKAFKRGYKIFKIKIKSQYLFEHIKQRYNK